MFVYSGYKTITLAKGMFVATVQFISNIQRAGYDISLRV
jgi:hypothetical protein